MVDRLGPAQHAHDAVQKVVVGRAADAAVAELDHAAFGGDDQVVVDADLAQLVHQNRGLTPARFDRMWLTSVVLPLPKKPVTSVTGTLSARRGAVKVAELSRGGRRRRRRRTGSWCRPRTG